MYVTLLYICITYTLHNINLHSSLKLHVYNRIPNNSYSKN